MRSILFSNEGVPTLGHLRRSIALAKALVSFCQGATALVVTGSPAFGGMQLAPAVDILKLPTGRVSADSPWSGTAVRPAAGLAIEREEMIALRAQLLLAIVERFRPDVVVSDHLPLGLQDDLRPALEFLRARAGCTIALGVRDVDDVSPKRLMVRWSPKKVEAVRHFYDLALVYGPAMPPDVRIARLLAAGVPVYHTGYVGEQPMNHGNSDLGEGYLLAMAGGGVDGFDVLDAVLGAIRTRPFDIPAVLVTGPMMERAEVTKLRDRAAGLAVRLIEFRSDMAAVIGGARVIVAMAGYCTVSEVLASGKPALLVPRTCPNEEQFNRARRLAAAGRVSMLLPNELQPVQVRSAIDELLERKPTTPEPLTGAAEAARILAQRAASL